MQAVFIKKLIQLVVKDDHGKEIGVCQLFIEGKTCTIFGLNGPKTLEFICSNHAEIKRQTECEEVKATCEVFMARLLQRYSKGDYTVKLGDSFTKYGKEFCEITISLNS